MPRSKEMVGLSRARRDRALGALGATLPWLPTLLPTLLSGAKAGGYNERLGDDPRDDQAYYASEHRAGRLPWGTPPGKWSSGLAVPCLQGWGEGWGRWQTWR